MLVAFQCSKCQNTYRWADPVGFLYLRRPLWLASAESVKIRRLEVSCLKCALKCHSGHSAVVLGLSKIHAARLALLQSYLGWGSSCRQSIGQNQCSTINPGREESSDFMEHL